MTTLNFEQELDFKNSTKCHICEKPFTDDDEDRVRDHCHLTGLYRGAAHMSCNINYKIPNFIPVVAHNLSNFDRKFILQKLHNNLEGEIKILPANMEKYKSFTKTLTFEIEKNDTFCKKTINLKFIDSLNFLMFSLEKLASYLSIYNITEYMFSNLHSADDMRLLFKKGVFPYDYVNSFEGLEEKKLPSINYFYNKLKNAHISEGEFFHAQKVWQTFNCKTILDYSSIYVYENRHFTLSGHL